jgi:hypothetical protein
LRSLPLQLWTKAKAPQGISSGNWPFLWQKHANFQRFARFGLQILEGVTPFWSVPNPGFDRFARSGLLNLAGI